MPYSKRAVQRILNRPTWCILWTNCTNRTILPHDGMLAWYMLWSCVCPSDCQSVTSRYSIKTAGCIIRQPMLHRPNSLATLVFDTKDFVKFELGHPNVRWHQMYGKLADIFIQHLAICQDRDTTMKCWHNRTQSVERYHFQQPSLIGQ